MSQAQEIEAKLIAVARPVSPLWQALTSLPALDEFVFAPLPEQDISDRYFDTNDGQLRHADLALRLREDDSGCTIAVKGKSTLSGNVISRMEFERPCSLEALAEIAALAREHGVELPLDPGITSVTGIGEGLARIGLVSWQARTTFRQRRTIRQRSGTTVIAELALDECQYRVGTGWAKHYEIEIEATNGSVQNIARLSALLHDRFTAQLRPWPHSKLATGAALTAIVTEIGINALVDGQTTLRPESYPDIERWLTHNTHP